MRVSWQNLSDDQRAGFFSGRAWLWGNSERGQVARVEWHHSRHPSSLACEVSTGGGDCEDELTFRLSLVFASYYLTFSGFLSRWRRHERTTGIGLSGDHLVIQWRCDDSSWSSRTGPAAGWQWSCFVLDKLLGGAKYREGEPETHRIAVPMPEATYHGTCVLSADSWKRPLWFRKTVRRAKVDMDEGQQVPFPGKGENSWDCGEDGIFGMTCPAASVDDAVRAIQESANRQRRKYGGRNWSPSHVV
jgi:hypothetical protein